MLTCRVVRISKRCRERVVENRGSFRERDAMLAEISGYLSGIPFEAHRPILGRILFERLTPAPHLPPARNPLPFDGHDLGVLCVGRNPRC